MKTNTQDLKEKIGRLRKAYKHYRSESDGYRPMGKISLVCAGLLAGKAAYSLITGQPIELICEDMNTTPEILTNSVFGGAWLSGAMALVGLDNTWQAEGVAEELSVAENELERITK